MLQGLAAIAQDQANKAEADKAGSIAVADMQQWAVSFPNPTLRVECEFWHSSPTGHASAVADGHKKEILASDLNYMLYGDREGPRIEYASPARRTWRERFKAFLGRASAAWLVLTGRLDPYDCD